MSKEWIAKDRMRILFLQDHLRMGGTEKQSLGLAKFGNHLGHEVGLVVFRPGGELEVDAGMLAFYKTLQPFNTRIDEWAPGIMGNILNFQPEAVVFMGKVAHLYAATIEKYLPSITRIATFRSGKPPVAYYQRAMQRAHGVIANSHAEQKRLISPYGIPEQLIHTVHNGCLLPPVGVGRKLNPDVSLRLLNVAMFRPQKNQVELLEILAQLPQSVNWRCTFAGTGKMLKACQAKAKELKLNARITFTWNSDPSELYANHDVLVHTSLKESLPNSLIEAQCCGLPVVAYLVNGVGECFEDGVSGIGIPLGSQAAFRDAIHLLSLDPKKLESMSQAAESFGKTNFAFEARAIQFFKVIESFHSSRQNARSE